MNEFDKIDAQCEVSRYSQMTPEEHAEIQAWMDEVDARMDILLLLLEPQRESRGSVCQNHIP